LKRREEKRREEKRREETRREALKLNHPISGRVWDMRRS
jgi:hypothetical protein